MTILKEMITNSLLYRFLSATYSLFMKYGPSSSVMKNLVTPPRYCSPKMMNGSLAYASISRVTGLLFSPLVTAGPTLRQWAQGSLLYCPDVPPLIAGSYVYRTLTGVRVETALWLVISYPVIDYLMRSLPALGPLSGIWDELLLLFIIFSWPIQAAIQGRPAYRYSSLDLPILIFAGITIFLFFMRSPNVFLAAEGARVYLEYILWFFIGSNLILNRHQFNALMTGITAVAALIAAVGIMQYIIGVQMPSSWVDQAETTIKTRVFSIVTSPNVLGSLLLFFIPITTAQLLTAKKRHSRIIYLAILAAELACMALTFSRGAWLALVGSAAVFSLMYNPLLLILMAAGAIAAVKLVPGIGARISYLFSSAYLASSSKGGRIALWQMGLDKLKQDPLFGTGFGSFGGAVAARKVPGSTYVDNFYLKTAVESGLIGLLAFLWILFSTFRCGYSAYKKIQDSHLKTMATAIIAGLLGVALHNAVENIFEVPMMATYFWFMAGVLISLPRIDDHSIKQAQDFL